MAELLLLVIAVLIVVSALYWRSVRREISKQRWGAQSRTRKPSQTENSVGRTLYEIIARVGPPINYSTVGQNLLVQWVGPGRHLSLLFEYRGPKPSEGGVVYISEHEGDFFCVRVKYQYFGVRWTFPPTKTASEQLPDRIAA